MSIVEQAPKPANPAIAFRKTAVDMASSLLKDWVGEDRAKEATGRIAAAVSSSAAAAKNPKDFYECTPASVATCVAVAALTGIMPSTGAAALAYLVPQSPRRNEPKQLSYMLSHRGLNALAQRCKQTMIAVPISKSDKIQDDGAGGIEIVERDIDNPPMTDDDLRGVIIIVKRLDTGKVIYSGWVPKKIIDARRAVSRSAGSEYSPWTTWPVEMAMKAAMHYAVTRGWCVIDDTEAVRALSVDTDSDLATVIDGSVSSPRIAQQQSALTDKLEEQARKQNESLRAAQVADYRSQIDEVGTRLSLLIELRDVVQADAEMRSEDKEPLISEITEKIEIIQQS
jgi:recombinational DNA repair protein RecT